MQLVTGIHHILSIGNFQSGIKSWSIVAEALRGYFNEQTTESNGRHDQEFIVSHAVRSLFGYWCCVITPKPRCALTDMTLASCCPVLLSSTNNDRAKTDIHNLFAYYDPMNDAQVFPN